MAFFTYKGLTKEGDEVDGRIAAPDSETAVRELRGRDIHVFEIKILDHAGTRAGKAGSLTNEDYYRLIEQLAALSAAGVNVLESIESLGSNAPKTRMREQLAKVAADLRQGQSLSSSFQRNMTGLPRYVPSLFRMAEATGNFSEVATLVSSQMAQSERLRRELQSALNYPVFLLAIGFITVGFLFYFVVPRFAGMVRGNEDKLPALSRAVFDLGTSFHDNFVIVAAAFAGGAVLLLAVSKSPGFQGLMTRLKFHTPVIGTLASLQENGAWLRVLGLATRSGARLLEALRLAGDAAASPGRQHVFNEVELNVRAGMLLSDAAQLNLSLDPLALNLLKTGERAGNLPDMLMSASRMYDENTQQFTRRLTELAEPVAIMVLSGIVGGVVISLVTAMTSIYDVAL